MNRHSMRGALCALGCLLTLGCAPNETRFHGFLENYEDLAPGPEVDFAYRKPDADLGSYGEVMIDPVVVWYSPDSDYRGIHSRDLHELSRMFHWSMRNALAKTYKVVQEPGPGVLRVRAAITDVMASRPGRDHFQAAIPPLRAISSAKEKMTGIHMYVGSATIEMELLDSQTNERLMAIVDRREGQKKVIKGFSSLADAREAFEYWAFRLRQQLDMEHVVK